MGGGGEQFKVPKAKTRQKRMDIGWRRGRSSEGQWQEKNMNKNESQQ